MGFGQNLVSGSWLEFRPHVGVTAASSFHPASEKKKKAQKLKSSKAQLRLCALPATRNVLCRVTAHPSTQSALFLALERMLGRRRSRSSAFRSLPPTCKQIRTLLNPFLAVFHLYDHSSPFVVLGSFNNPKLLFHG